MYFNVQHISKCDACQRTNNPIKKKLPPLNSVAVPDTPWRQVGLDLIGPLPETDFGYKYVATMTDYFSKWTEAEAVDRTIWNHRGVFKRNTETKELFDRKHIHTLSTNRVENINMRSRRTSIITHWCYCLLKVVHFVESPFSQCNHIILLSI